ncbi:MAG: DUF6056 family protein [Spirosomataceae bacterium]
MTKWSKIVGFTAIYGSFVSIVFAITYFSFWNEPSISDDYCFADTAIKYGFWETQKLYYLGWSGRFTGTLITHANPLFFKQLWLAKIVPILILGFLLLCLFRFCWVVLSELSVGSKVLFSSLLSSFVLWFMPSYLEGFYWQSGAYQTVCASLLILTLASFIKFKQTRFEVNWMLLGLVFITAGSSEVIMLVLDMLIASYVLYQWFIKNQISKDGLILLAITVVTSLIVVAAPGNEIRMQASGSSDFFFSLTKAINEMIVIVKGYLFQTPLLLVTSWFLFIYNGKKLSQLIKSTPWYWIGLVWIVAVFIAVFIPIYGYGSLPGRVMNIIHILFVIGWFLIFVGIKEQMVRRARTTKIDFTISTVSLFVVIATSIWLRFSPNFNLLVREYRGQIPQKYSSEVQERRVKLENIQWEKVTLKPIQNQSALLFHEDIHDDSTHLWNRCLANYYNKKYIFLEN